MSIKKILSAFLILSLVLIPLVSCKKDDDEDNQDDLGDDEFSGSISGSDVEDGNDEPPAPPVETPPIGEGNASDVVEIRTADDLKKINRKGTYILADDIDLTGVAFSPIGTYTYPFEGTFDGNGHKLINLKISSTAEDVGPALTFKYTYAGLFGVTKNATIKNITVENADISASSTTEFCFVSSGAIVGYAVNTAFEDCSVVGGKIYAKSKYFNSYSGSISGIMQGGKVTKAATSATVETDDSENRASSGGIAGYSFGGTVLDHCTSKDTVKAVSSYGVAYAAGLVGNARRIQATACRSEATVYAEVVKMSASNGTSGAATAGGLFAVISAESDTSKSTVTRCYAIDKEVAAKGNDNSVYAGGIAAKIRYTDFKDCYSLCNVTASSDTKLVYAASAFAEIIGSDVSSSDYSVKGCFATGNVSATNKNPAYVYIGTFCAFPKELSATKAVKVAYNKSATYTLNGEAPKSLTKNGYEIAQSSFTLSFISNMLGWNSAEWETVNGIISAK